MDGPTESSKNRAKKQINGSFVVGFPLFEFKILTEMELMWQ